MPKLAIVLAFLGIASFAAPAHARVTISEIAWMGTDQGATCEWIELHNDADEIVSLAGWTLTLENPGSATTLDLGNPASVKYSGIDKAGYYLIVRDSPNSGNACKDLEPGKHADWLGSFGSGISNDGAKLILKHGASEEDTLDSKASWDASKGGAGGKNAVPKETPQRTLSGWYTAIPTPRGPNMEPPLEELPEDEEDEPGTPVVTVGGTAPVVPLKHPAATLYVDGGAARIVMAGAETPYSGVAYDSTGVLRKNADITWSFGDGGYKKGEEVAYAYRTPGEYTAVVRARSKGISAVALVPVVVVPPPVIIRSASEEGIMLSNGSDDIADLSSWKLGSGKRSVKLPPDTVIAPGATVLFSYEALHIPPSDAPTLRFPNGRLAYAYAQPLVAGTSSDFVQEVESLPAPAAYSEGAYAQEMPAPAEEAKLPSVGAAASADEHTVVLKGEPRGIPGFLSDLVASIASVVVP